MSVERRPIANGEVNLSWPWQDRNGRVSWLKAGVFALMFAPGGWLLYQYESGDFGRLPLAGLTYWSGLWATAMLLLALAVTPLRTILRSNQLILVRRMIGVTALAYTFLHILIYFALRFWDFIFIALEMATRISLVVATISTLGLIALGATSLDEAIRRMGLQNWNRLHNTVYVLTGLAVVHYLLSPDYYSDQYLMAGLFAWLMGWRALNAKSLGTDARALMALALVSALFAAFLEAGWTWAYLGYEPSFALANNFNLVLGISPAWKILITGVLASFAALAGKLTRRRTAA